MGKHDILYHIWNWDAYQIRCVMSRSDKILKTISSLIENGILTSKDIQKEIFTDIKFKRDKIVSKLDLVTREEFEILKKLVLKQDEIIKKLKRKTKFKKAKKS